jgi:hypothetical protein
MIDKNKLVSGLHTLNTSLVILLTTSAGAAAMLLNINRKFSMGKLKLYLLS